MSTDPNACPLPNRNEDTVVRDLLASIQTIAVVGMSSRPGRPSLGVGMYLKKKGYRIVPVHPRESEIAGIAVYPDVQSIPSDIRIDLVNIFVSGEKSLPVVEQAAARGVPAVWFQPGAEYQPSESRARNLGLQVISGRCTMADHVRLF